MDILLKYKKYKFKYLTYKKFSSNEYDIFYKKKGIKDLIFPKNEQIILKIEENFLKNKLKQIKDEKNKDEKNKNYYTIFNGIKIFFPIIIDDNLELSYGFNFSTNYSVFENIILSRLNIYNNCNDIILDLYFYDNKISYIELLQINKNVKNIIYNGEKLTSNLLKEIIKRCLRNKDNITLICNIFILDENYQAHGDNHTVFLHFTIINGKIIINYLSYDDTLIKNLLNKLFKIILNYENIEIFSNDDSCTIQGKLNELKEDDIIYCFKHIIESKKNIISEFNLESDYLETKFEFKLNFSNFTEKNKEELLLNINGSCNTIALIYKCFYLLNSHIDKNIRLSIIDKYLNSLDLSLIIKLILYYQAYIFNFMKKICIKDIFKKDIKKNNVLLHPCSMYFDKLM